jgi:phosphoribosylaminoimidazolecarboxamide formyltransferase/IMP cyclohydrolase
MSPAKKARPGTDRRTPARGEEPARRRGLRALLSVADKAGLVPFAKGLVAASFEIVSTGGTAKALRAAGVPVIEVATVTGFPEIMDGRVKTLHPHIHGGLLARQGIDEGALGEHDIGLIDVLAVNLYPFEATTARPDCTDAEAIENIDIGGPAMLRAAAKNHERVTVVVDPADYPMVLAALEESEVPAGLRRDLAIKAFAYTARYDTAISNYLRTHNASPAPWPDPLLSSWRLAQPLRYGENPHQHAALYRASQARAGTVAHAKQVQGKELSFNNIVDADAAYQAVNAFSGSACVIVKHANPCGIAVAATPALAYGLAYRTDPTSAFGGVIAFNRPLDEPTATAIVARQFAEVIVAPEIGRSALAALAKKPNIRVLEAGWPSQSASGSAEDDVKTIDGGLLVQSRDTGAVDLATAKVVTHRAPTAAELRDLQFAWSAVKFVKSNAIVYAHDAATLGIGAGQPSRVMSARIGAIKAGEANLAIEGAVLASDAFFPFRDGIDAAAEHGVRAIVQPGGSMRDDEVVAAANEHGIAMVFTGMRHFRH